MLKHEFVSIAITEMQDLRDLAESHRRERASMPTTPMPGLVDYASAGVALDNGWQHMNESIVHGQKQRTEAAAELVTLGLYHTLQWLKATGYKVPTLLWHWDEPHEMVSDNLDVLPQAPTEAAYKVLVNGEPVGTTDELKLPTKVEINGDIHVDAVSEEAAKKVWQELRDLLEDLKTQGYVIDFTTGDVKLPAEPAEELTVDDWNAEVSSVTSLHPRQATGLNALESFTRGIPLTEVLDESSLAYSPLTGKLEPKTSVELFSNICKTGSAKMAVGGLSASVLEAMDRAGEVPAKPYDPLKDPTSDGYAKVIPPVKIRTEPEDISAKLHNFAILATDAIALLSSIVEHPEVAGFEAAMTTVRKSQVKATLAKIAELKL